MGIIYDSINDKPDEHDQHERESEKPTNYNYPSDRPKKKHKPGFDECPWCGAECEVDMNICYACDSRV